ncbi:MAG: putative ATPase [Flammeovirgaceae bacterium]|jgi:predicted ATPase
MLNRIEIENFKSIREMKLELGDINVLIGANGVGKSNFISFFSFLHAIYSQELQLYVANQAGADNLLYRGSKNSDYIYSRVEFNHINAYHFSLISDNQDDLFFEFEADQFNREEGGQGASGWHNKKYGEGHRESLLPDLKYKRHKYVQEYLSSFKVFHFHDTSPTAKVKRKGAIDDNHFLREDAGNLAAYLFWMQEKFPNSFRKIEKSISSVAPFFQGFDLKPDRNREDKIQLEWKERDSDMYLNGMHLSDGTLRFMALATLLLQPEPPSVIIIDEPELGLHPFAIHKLSGLIEKASAHSQIIISTQSTTLVNKFEPENIITVDRENGQSVFKTHNSKELAGWLENYSIGEIWNKNIIGGRP